MDTPNTNTEHDTPQAPTEQDAKVVDKAVEETPDTSVEDAISAALKGEDAPQEGGPEDDGKKPENGSAKPSEGGPEKDGEKPKVEEPKKDEDDLLDGETPKDMKEQATKNFERLKERARSWRETAQQHEAAIADMQPRAEWGGRVMDMLTQSGGTAEDLAAGIGIIHAVVRGTTENKQRALEEVEKIRVTLSAQLGRPISGVSHVSEFADIQKAIDEGEISPAVAEELAATRKAAQLRQQRETAEEQERRQRHEEGQQQAEHERALTTAQQSVERLAEAYLAADGKEVYETRVQYAMNQVRILKDMGTQVPPEKIPEVFTRFYRSPEADQLVQAKNVAKARVAPGAKPVMGSRMGGTGGASREATSMDDAILSALRGE